jgi:nicotinamidase-related amidase
MNAALCVIDVQNEYFKPHGKRVLPDGEKALLKVMDILTSSRESGVPVIHVVHNSLDAGAQTFRAGEPGAAMHPALQVLLGERLVTKHFPGSFTGTPLEAYLRQGQVDTLLIAGFMTQMCCDTTTRQAKERGMDVWFLSDATAANDLRLGDEIISHEVVHKTELAVMASFGAKIMTVAEAVDRLGKR